MISHTNSNTNKLKLKEHSHIQGPAEKTVDF